MSKSHRDNAKARKKRGLVAYEKKAKRRKPTPKCLMCGSKCRPHKLTEGVCPKCWGRM